SPPFFNGLLRVCRGYSVVDNLTPSRSAPSSPQRSQRKAVEQMQDCLTQSTQRAQRKDLRREIPASMHALALNSRREFFASHSRLRREVVEEYTFVLSATPQQTNFHRPTESA